MVVTNDLKWKKQFMTKLDQTIKIQDNQKKKRQKWDEETIIAKGRELFSLKGFNLTMRDLAKELNTKASSLYRHVQSKRELWFAIITRDFEDFGKGMQDVAMNHSKKPALEILRNVGQYFLDFARADFNRFKLMFLYEPPKDEKAGPFEQACDPNSLKDLIMFCQMIVEEEKLTKIQANELAIIIYAQILGFATITSPINDYILQQEDYMYIKKEGFENFFLEKLIEGILIYR
jgi:AcrR family transcriptional regulator